MATLAPLLRPPRLLPGFHRVFTLAVEARASVAEADGRRGAAGLFPAARRVLRVLALKVLLLRFIGGSVIARERVPDLPEGMPCQKSYEDQQDESCAPPRHERQRVGDDLPVTLLARHALRQVGNPLAG